MPTGTEGYFILLRSQGAMGGGGPSGPSRAPLTSWGRVGEGTPEARWRPEMQTGAPPSQPLSTDGSSLHVTNVLLRRPGAKEKIRADAGNSWPACKEQRRGGVLRWESRRSLLKKKQVPAKWSLV